MRMKETIFSKIGMTIHRYQWHSLGRKKIKNYFTLPGRVLLIWHCKEFNSVKDCYISGFIIDDFLYPGHYPRMDQNHTISTHFPVWGIACSMHDYTGNSLVKKSQTTLSKWGLEYLFSKKTLNNPKKSFLSLPVNDFWA